MAGETVARIGAAALLAALLLTMVGVRGSAARDAEIVLLTVASIALLVEAAAAIRKRRRRES